MDEFDNQARPPASAVRRRYPPPESQGEAPCERSDDAHSNAKPKAFSVGYGKPPTHTQFKKGQSGNPKGRPSRRRDTMTLVGEVVNRPMVLRDGDTRRHVTALQATLIALFQSAIKGNSQAQRMALDLAIKLDQLTERQEIVAAQQIEAPETSPENKAILAAYERDVLRRYNIEPPIDAATSASHADTKKPISGDMPS